METSLNSAVCWKRAITTKRSRMRAANKNADGVTKRLSDRNWRIKLNIPNYSYLPHICTNPVRFGPIYLQVVPTERIRFVITTNILIR